jgi:hypothetical protein
MNTIMESVGDLEESARKNFGGDIRIMLARCPAWGHEDICILISGSKHRAAAAPFRRLGAQISEREGAGFGGLPPYTYSAVEIAS